MTVKELIEELEKVENKNLQIRIHGTGPDGWTYYNDLEWCEREKVCEEIFSEGDYGHFGTKIIYRYRFVISGGMF
jgi:hypothetical protein